MTDWGSVFDINNYFIIIKKSCSKQINSKLSYFHFLCTILDMEKNLKTDFGNFELFSSNLFKPWTPKIHTFQKFQNTKKKIKLILKKILHRQKILVYRHFMSISHFSTINNFSSFCFSRLLYMLMTNSSLISSLV